MDSLRRCRRSGSVRSQPPAARPAQLPLRPLAAAPRLVPSRLVRGCAGGRAGAQGKLEGRAREGSFVDFTVANIWAQRGPPLAASPPPRLGDPRGLSPKDGDFDSGPGRKEERGVGRGLAQSRELFPVSPPLPGSFPAGRGRGRGRADESRRFQVPGILGLGTSGFSCPLPTPVRRVSPSVHTAWGHWTERRPDGPGGPSPAPHPATLLETQLTRASFPRCTLAVRAGEGAARGHPAGRGGSRAGSVRRLDRSAGPGEGPRGSGCPSRSAEAGEPGRAGRAGGFRALTRSRLPLRSPPGCSSGRCAEAAKQLQPPPRRSTLAPCAMVTHSKFPAAGMSRPLDTSLRLKTFSSKSEYQLVVNAVRKLQESGFYWSAVTGGEANLLLSAEPAGTFLIRDSSDQRHFFTLSVKTQSGTKNLRIQCEGGSFSLQSDPRSTQPVPRFDCVLKLVHHYMPPPGAPSFPSPPTEPSSEVPEQPSAQPLPGSPPRRAYYIYSGGEKIPLVLSRPLSSNVATLQHLCRKTVNGHLDSYEKVTQLPGPIREFLDQYDAPL